MGLFSNSGKNKQETTAEESGFYTSPDDAAGAEARSKRASSAGAPAPRRARAKAGADPILPEKKRARRRLVGAIALALAVAVGLPMLLDSEPKPLSSDIDIRIPSKERVVAAAPVAPSAALDEREEIVETPAAAAPREVATVDVATPKPALKMVPKEDKSAEAKVAAPPKPVEKPAEKPADKVVAKKVEEKPVPAEAARAIAILEDKPVDAAGQKFVVQVASLASQEKVDELRARLRAEGINSFTQKVKTKEGELIRVRVGPSSKEDADKTRAKLSKLGLGGSVVPA
ncbi:SPOR domain-containing protein [Massilia soli]|uniref:SPOR domain-containing protein n=1 Tax=Massilia soli TaxID=2792854 RepID=A0ABS7SRF7_9BURK|nr:SPOR domain-containing protein [Massilia soli]MBZ2208539.1 SPOR domain-containing protein [Massilia soli]